MDKDYYIFDKDNEITKVSIWCKSNIKHDDTNNDAEIIHYDVPESEVEFFNIIMNKINNDNLKVAKTNQKCSSILYNNANVCDFKYTPRSKWIEFQILDKRKYRSLHLFANVNKDIYRYKVQITDLDKQLNDILFVINDMIKEYDKYNN